MGVVRPSMYLIKSIWEMGKIKFQLTSQPVGIW